MAPLSCLDLLTLAGLLLAFGVAFAWAVGGFNDL
jgi:hypothetical protein